MPWVDIAEAAFTLGVSERTIRNWLKSGKLEARNSNGRREVHIPDSDGAQNGQAFMDDDEGGEENLGVQKRLEVALIECGRVKGTLASQERMMESLSSNIAELNAKLQSNERVIARRTIWCVAIAFVGLLGWVLTKSFDEARIADKEKAHITEKGELKDSYNKELIKKQDEFIKKNDDVRKEYKDELKVLKADMEKEKSAALTKLEADLTKRHTEEVTLLREEIKGLKAELDKVKTAKITAEANLTAKKGELELNETKLAETENRIAELEKTRQELEAEVVKLKAR
ncbi:MAG: hypothetical protein JXR97_05865 [Planctomycetes bacterium]|nr:hypothetical protein [Planctomycetota bacterium]